MEHEQVLGHNLSEQFMTRLHIVPLLTVIFFEKVAEDVAEISKTYVDSEWHTLSRSFV